MAFNPERKVRLNQDIVNNLISKAGVKNPELAKEIARKWARM